MSGPQRLLPPLPVLRSAPLENGDLHNDEHGDLLTTPLVERHRMLINRLAQRRIEQHREALEKHKQKGPAFRQAVEDLENSFASASK